MDANRWEALARWSMNQRRTVLAIAMVGMGLAIWSVMGLRHATSNLDLVDPHDPVVREFLSFAERFGNPSPLILVLEGEERMAEVALASMEAELKAVVGFRLVVTQNAGLGNGTQAGSFFHSDDGKMTFAFLQPSDVRNRLDALLEPLANVDAILAKTRERFPLLRIGTTGIPRYALDDRDQIQNDIGKLSWLAFVVIGTLFFLGFHEWRRPLLACITLLVGVVWCAGIIRLWPGHLTLLSASFASILFGLGIDSGIHIVQRFEELMGEGLSEAQAIPRAIGELGEGLWTATLTSALVFYGLSATGFKGFQELGQIAGSGILLCLLANLTVLPALLASFPAKMKRSRAIKVAAVWHFLSSKSFFAPLLFALSVLAFFMPWPRFDGNYLNLQPANSNAVRLERAMVAHSTYAPTFAAFTRNSATEASVLVQQLKAASSVGVVRSYEDLYLADDTFLLERMDRLGELKALFRSFVSEKGQFAIYAYPAGNIWDPHVKELFLSQMSAIDATVTGMPILGEHMVAETLEALEIATSVSALLILLCLLIQFKNPARALLAALPALLSLPLLLAGMAFFAQKFNPMNVMALPILLGIAVDDGIHLVHRFQQEGLNLKKTLSGAGRGVLLTSLTTIAGFGALSFSSHRGMRSLSLMLALGVALALIQSLLVLPFCLRCATRWGWFPKRQDSL